MREAGRRVFLFDGRGPWLMGGEIHVALPNGQHSGAEGDKTSRGESQSAWGSSGRSPMAAAGALREGFGKGEGVDPKGFVCAGWGEGPGDKSFLKRVRRVWAGCQPLVYSLLLG